MKTRIRHSEFMQVVGDGMIASPRIHGGRLIPVLILGCSSRRDIADLIRLHAGAGIGDVISTWGRARWPDSITILNLKFVRPTPGELTIQFHFPKHLMLVDLIINTHACYLQSDDWGNKLSGSLETGHRILAEIPATGLPFDWDEDFEKHLYKQFRGEGLSRTGAKLAAKEAKKTSRELFKIPKRA
jgi:hypothetical protein